ncbi:ROK family transcriptional regulator [Halobacillus salinarum]|uniref:ROK family transcriptional regulator n=1 Tax=Halobacillus salinarum TaxID=2932257 RepID=A0ABY4EHL0_9BACI|nr:ROK family transcriptional regulator [Halobacillus salinarum]UOQ43639.1 ROK family transcriptional regulator [Halobacillus salinarum]
MSTQIRGSFHWMKSLNKSIILNKIRMDGPISRADIAKQTKLTPPTVSSIVKELIESKLVIESNQGESSGGRKPTMLMINASNFFVIGLDIGPKWLRAVIADLNGKSYDSAIHHIPASITEQLLIELTTDTIESIFSAHPESQEKVIGIGIGMHGVVDADAGIATYAPSLDLRNIPFKEVLEKKFNLIVKVENDARALSLGEAWFGKGSNSEHVITVNVGRGIGAGIVIDNKLFRGKHQIAGEIGHMTIDLSGPLCDCGNYGCLQTLAAGPALVKRAVKSMSMHPESSLHSFKEEDITGKVIYEEAVKGDAFCKEIFEETGVYLGTGLTNVIHTLNPERIVIGGGLANAGDLLLDPIKATITRKALTKEAKETEIVFSNLGKFGTALGAVSLLLVEMFAKAE